MEGSDEEWRGTANEGESKRRRRVPCSTGWGGRRQRSEPGGEEVVFSIFPRGSGGGRRAERRDAVSSIPPRIKEEGDMLYKKVTRRHLSTLWRMNRWEGRGGGAAKDEKKKSGATGEEDNKGEE